MTQTQMEIVSFIKSTGGKTTTGQVAKKFNLTIVCTSKMLRALIEVHRIGGRGPNAKWRIAGV